MWATCFTSFTSFTSFLIVLQNFPFIFELMQQKKKRKKHEYYACCFFIDLKRNCKVLHLPNRRFVTFNCQVVKSTGIKSRNFLYQGNHFQEASNKIKDLIEELEESFRESHKVGNNLILRCVLLRAENQNLIYQIDEKNRNYTYALYHGPAALSRSKSQTSEDATIPYWNELRACLSEPLALRKRGELNFLQKTVTDLQNKLKDKEKRIENLCQKYAYLKNDKSKMENELKSKIVSLEKQLDLSYDILKELQSDLEIVTGKSLCLTQNTYEALFLQEKLRCNKLMYEKIRMHHEMQRLEDLVRRQGAGKEDIWEARPSLDKSTSEPLMRRFPSFPHFV